MAPDPMPPTCPTCGTPMVPVLTEHRDRDEGPLPAEVPVSLVCPRCTPID